MNLKEFIAQEESKVLLEKVFSKGVQVIYEDALEKLFRERELLNKLLKIENLPSEITSSFLDSINRKKEVKEEKNLFIIKNYEKWEPATPESFFQHFYSRYYKLSQFLARRPQLKGVVSIAQIFRIKGRESVPIIGMVKEIRKMKDGRKIIEVEDPTGSISVLISSGIKNAEEIILDDVVGIRGQAGRGIFFAEEIIYPDIPFTEGWPKSRDLDVFLVSDIHAGSKKFNEEIWESFVDYVNREKKIKYIIVAGDLVDGIGVYQGQEKELEFSTAEEEYEYLSSLLKKIREDVFIIAIPGNHDPTRDAEPQPIVPEEFASPIYKLKNFKMLSNPAWISIEGVLFLVYHGTSLDGIIDSIESIRNIAYKDPSKAQIQLLKKRHLSPIFGRNRIFPDKDDFLVIDPLPNVFVTGHVHTTSTSVYRGVRLISAGTFQERTAFQEKLGHIPTPGKFVRLNLKSGEMKIIEFL